MCSATFQIRKWCLSAINDTGLDVETSGFRHCLVCSKETSSIYSELITSHFNFYPKILKVSVKNIIPNFCSYSSLFEDDSCILLDWINITSNSLMWHWLTCPPHPCCPSPEQYLVVTFIICPRLVVWQAKYRGGSVKSLSPHTLVPLIQFILQ